MIQRTHAQGLGPILQAVDESWRALVFARDPGEDGSARAAVNSLHAWPTDELFAEVLVRSAEDTPALRLMQTAILRALLTSLDRESSDGPV